MRESIGYTVTVEDAVAASEFHLLRSSKALQKQKRQRVILTIAFVLGFMMLGNELRASAPSSIAPWFPLLCGLFGGALYYGLTALHIGFPQLFRFQVRKHYADPETSKYLGEHSLEVDDQGFTHRTPYTETRYSWGALERIETGQDHTYLYISANQLLVIPHKSITEGNFAALLTAVKAYYKPGQGLERAGER